MTFLSGGITAAVGAARAPAGGRSAGILGASVAGQCLERGLLDEIVVHLVPVLPGGGVRLYDAAGAGAILLERTAGSDPGRSPTSAGVS